MQSIPCFYFAPQPIYPDEVFLDIPYTEMGFGFNHHKVSNYGRVFNVVKQCICNKHIDSKGYEYIISGFNGEKKLYRVHRLLLAAFCYFPGCENLLVNHKDGIKNHNFLCNLEWATYSENTLHAYNKGLITNKQGEDRVASTITNVQAIEICERLQNGDRVVDIANSTGISDNVIYSIKCRRSWKFISDNYSFKVNDTHFTEDEVNSLCKYFEYNKINDGETKNDYFRRALRYCKCDTDKKSVDILGLIYKRKAYKGISKNYKF